MKNIQKYTTQAINAPNTGEILKDFFKKRRISKAALARTLNRASPTVAKYVKNNSIQTSVLWEICHALKHNFLLDIAVQLPTDYTTNSPIDSTKDERIAQLTQENALLKAQNQVLVEVAKR